MIIKSRDTKILTIVNVACCDWWIIKPVSTVVVVDSVKSVVVPIIT